MTFNFAILYQVCSGGSYTFSQILCYTLTTEPQQNITFTNSKTSFSIFRGVALRMTEPLYEAPSLSDLSSEIVFPQNLPSIVCVHVLDPQPGERILDMCAAPGQTQNVWIHNVDNHNAYSNVSFEWRIQFPPITIKLMCMTCTNVILSIPFIQCALQYNICLVFVF